jgi:hypothetical protein
MRPPAAVLRSVWNTRSNSKGNIGIDSRQLKAAASPTLDRYVSKSRHVPGSRRPPLQSLRERNRDNREDLCRKPPQLCAAPAYRTAESEHSSNRTVGVGAFAGSSGRHGHLITRTDYSTVHSTMQRPPAKFRKFDRVAAKDVLAPSSLFTQNNGHSPHSTGTYAIRLVGSTPAAGPPAHTSCRSAGSNPLPLVAKHPAKKLAILRFNPIRAAGPPAHANCRSAGSNRSRRSLEPCKKAHDPSGLVIKSPLPLEIFPTPRKICHPKAEKAHRAAGSLAGKRSDLRWERPVHACRGRDFRRFPWLTQVGPRRSDASSFGRFARSAAQGAQDHHRLWRCLREPHSVFCGFV